MTLSLIYNVEYMWNSIPIKLPSIWHINLMFLTVVLAKGVFLIYNNFSLYILFYFSQSNPKYISKTTCYVMVSMQFKITCLLSLKTNKRSVETGKRWIRNHPGEGVVGARLPHLSFPNLTQLKHCSYFSRMEEKFKKYIWKSLKMKSNELPKFI